MKKQALLFLLITLFFFGGVNAQHKSHSLTGDYYLRGVMETASGFQLKADSSFIFYFSYGALDRFGSGKWSVVNNTVILNSREKPAFDFSLVKKDHVEGDSITVRIIDNNPSLLSHVFCTLKETDIAYENVTDKHGEIKFPKQEIDSVRLIFEFCPERSSDFCIELEDRGNNYFEFKFEPWVTEVFFENFTLSLGDDVLKGPHPLIDGTTFTYIKVQK